MLRVAEVNRAAKAVLQDRFGEVWIEGELSDVTRSRQGHVYFTLNDEREPAQLRGVIFQSDARRARAELRNGARLRMRGALTIYEPRGSYQLVARIALPVGEGDLAAKFEQIKARLEAEGLLDPARRRALPRAPRVVGIVTSETSAALQDVIRVGASRCPTRMIVADCQVQGLDAPASIVRALEAIARVPAVQVVILTRGGGAAEDLWAFNDERVARAVARSPIPIVCAVGHETDVCIAELVADRRASTPSNAAEIVIPEARVLEAELEAWMQRLERAMETRLDRERLTLERTQRIMGDPRRAIRDARARLASLESELGRAIRARLGEPRATLRALHGALLRHDARAALRLERKLLERASSRLPRILWEQLSARRERLARLSSRLRSSGLRAIQASRRSFGEEASRLHALSPLRVLERGYSIAIHERTGLALRRAAEAEPGDRISLRLSDGVLPVRVEEA